MVRRMIITCVTATVVAACGSTEVGGLADDGGSAGAQSGKPALEGFPDAGLCDLLTDQSVAKALKVKVDGHEGSRRGKAAYAKHRCDYETDSGPELDTYLEQVQPGKSDQEELDRVFLEFPEEGEDEAGVGKYEPVDGLGDTAGFGRNTVLADAWDLGVVFSVGQKRLVLTLSVSGRAELAQLRPLAEELMANAEAKLS